MHPGRGRGRGGRPCRPPPDRRRRQPTRRAGRQARRERPRRQRRAGWMGQGPVPWCRPRWGQHGAPAEGTRMPQHQRDDKTVPGQRGSARDRQARPTDDLDAAECRCIRLRLIPSTRRGARHASSTGPDHREPAGLTLTAAVVPLERRGWPPTRRSPAPSRSTAAPRRPTMRSSRSRRRRTTPSRCGSRTTASPGRRWPGRRARRGT